jgi:tRNA modification GTPase
MAMVDLSDTICALSSAPGRSGIAVVRLSGSRSGDILAQIFAPADSGRRQIPDRLATLGRVADPRTGSELDEALVTFFHAPHSYTGEDVAEISVHGSPAVIAYLLDCLCSLGARLAEPGEFTMRAFLHGRMDLAQAEAVRDLIEADTLHQAQVALRQRSGELSRELTAIKEPLLDVIIRLEAAVEFVEDDVPCESRDALAARLEELLRALDKWIASFRRGRIVRHGFSLAVVGGPNVGKSSLFNALLLEERSIVTEAPGTTRDLVSEITDIEGIAVRLIDTAGVRDGADPVEQIGVDRTLRAMADADAVLLVLDTSRPCTDEDARLRARLSAMPCIVALNKADLPSVWSLQQRAEYGSRWPCVEVSALKGVHIRELREAIRRQFFGDSARERDGLLVTNLRHCRCLEACQRHVAGAAHALQSGLSEEFVLTDLRAALERLGEITGETSAEDLLGEIFSRFCIGK